MRLQSRAASVFSRKQRGVAAVQSAQLRQFRTSTRYANIWAPCFARITSRQVKDALIAQLQPLLRDTALYHVPCRGLRHGPGIADDQGADNGRRLSRAVFAERRLRDQSGRTARSQLIAGRVVCHGRRPAADRADIERLCSSRHADQNAMPCTRPLDAGNWVIFPVPPSRSIAMRSRSTAAPSQALFRMVFGHLRRPRLIDRPGSRTAG